MPLSTPVWDKFHLSKELTVHFLFDNILSLSPIHRTRIAPMPANVPADAAATDITLINLFEVRRSWAVRVSKAWPTIPAFIR
jgi:hypothetical protein